MAAPILRSRYQVEDRSEALRFSLRKALEPVRRVKDYLGQAQFHFARPPALLRYGELHCQVEGAVADR